MCRSLSPGFSQSFKRAQIDDLLLGRLAVRKRERKSVLGVCWGLEKQSGLPCYYTGFANPPTHMAKTPPLGNGRMFLWCSHMRLLGPKTASKHIPFIGTQWALQNTYKCFSCSTNCIWKIILDFSLNCYIEFGGYQFILYLYKLSTENHFIQSCL